MMFGNSISASEIGLVFYECKNCGHEHSIMLSKLNECIECGHERFNVIADVSDK